jgi:gluconate 2-dehydrogenase gamma chain
MADDKKRMISRRDLLKGAGMAGAAAILPVGLAPAVAEPSAAPATPAMSSIATAPRPRRLENLTAKEGELLEAIMGRLIPNDQYGPGAVEAGTINFVDRALGGFLSESLESYRDGLAAFDRYCRISRGAPFVELSTVDQDSALIDCESGAATASGAGFPGSSGSFFSMVKGHTWQGMFGDPYYGGNANFIGWALIGYPGVRTAVSAADQERMERGELPMSGRSAYDNDMFEEAVVRIQPQGEVSHGD